MPNTVPEGETTHLSDPSPHSQRPPRLATAINSEIVGPDRSLKGDNSAVLPFGAEVTATHITEILDWVVARLEDDAGWNAVWDNPGGEHPLAGQGSLSDAEETWARFMDELFLGTAYGGPSIVSQLSQRFTYRRFARMNEEPRVAPWERKQDGSNEKPAAQAAPPAPNPDPVYSVFVACQHLTTYGALGRGLSFETDLTAAGIPASQLASALDVFDKGPGQWLSNGKVKIISKEREAAGVVPWGQVTAVQAHNVKAASELSPGQYGPGTIYTYNPLGHADHVLADVLGEDVIFDDETGVPIGANPIAAIGKLVEAGEVAAEKNKLVQMILNSAQSALEPLGLEVPDAPPLEVTLQEVLDPGKLGVLGTILPIYTVKLPLKYVQLGGSHVSMILRRYTASGDNEVVQMFDTSAHATGGGVGVTSSDDIIRDYEMFQNVGIFRGIYAGEAFATAPRGSARFVGMGTMPPLTDAAAVRAHLERARPAALARLVIVDQRDRPDSPTADDILFVSRMIPMWSASVPTRNFHISRLLYSLRNTPFRRELKTYWVVYAPRGTVAAAMWQEGARTANFDAELESSPTADMSLAAAVLCHSGDGKALELWRDKGPNRVGEGTLPKTIREVFINTGTPPVELFKKKAEELNKAVLALQAAFGKAGQKLERALVSGDTAAIEEAKTEIAELQAEAARLRSEAADFMSNPLDEKHLPPVFAARNRPLATFVSSATAGSVGMPTVLR